MDFDDIDDPAKAPPQSSRFAPKSRKFQPKSKQRPKVEPKVEPPVPAQADEPPAPVVVKKEEDSSMEPKEEEKRDFQPQPLNDEAMEENVEEDQVVAEYSVYFTPCDANNAQFFVLQYPLRPLWRPYQLDQRCTEVRVRPNTAEVEVDLSIDVDSDNYDRDSPAAQKMMKQTLSSSWEPPQATGSYAAGVLTGKKLYVNPIRAVVQLRPSMEHLDSGGSKKRSNPNIAVKEGGSSVTGLSRKQNKQVEPEVIESWVPLKYHNSTTELAERYLRKMISEEKNPLQFSMNPYDYLNSVCPGVVTKMKTSGPSRRSLLSLPLEERLKKCLVEGPSVQRFSAIKHVAPDYPDEDVLEVLQRYAHLVQGLWVTKTAIRLSKAQGAEPLARDYALLLFSQRPVIKDSELDVLGSQKSTGKAVLREIAVERPYCKDWKFKEPTDASFMKLYPDVVEHQSTLWQANEKRMLEVFAKRKAGPISKSSNGSGPPMRSEEGVLRASGARSVSTSMSKETREVLRKVLGKLFQTHKVCSFQTICQGLREMAVSMSTLPKGDARAAAAIAAANTVDASPEELQAVINELAANIHGVYVLKSSSEHPEFNPLRNIVIDLFLGNGPNAKLKKGEIIEAAKIKLQKEPTNNEFQKVITEFCVSKGGAWVLKSGDRDSK